MTPEQATKRARVMRRSLALGHCVCNALKPCPCDSFKAHNICECAGERRPTPSGEVGLIANVRRPGCASKINKQDLERVLRGLPELEDRRVLVGRSAGDDAGVVMLPAGEATILTVDVFTPTVDDPYAFGQIAAANSVSDVYAMGGTPQSALSIIGFPADHLPLEAMREILRGGIEKMREAGISVIGGHSINDEETKFGFAVVGSAPAAGIIRNSGAQVGDAIVLTKPLGSGIICFAAQCGRDVTAGMEQAVRSMSTLNLCGLRLTEHGAHAATDITGFSLLGHLSELVKNSEVAVEIDFDQIPFFTGVVELAQQEVLPGAIERNREAVPEEQLELAALSAWQQEILFGPETSGGLLVCLPEAGAGRLLEEMREQAVQIGHVVGRAPGGRIRVTTQGAAPHVHEPVPPAEPVACCGEMPPPQGLARRAEGGLVPLSLSCTAALASYMKAVNAPGALDARSKRLISLALSVVGTCAPCVRNNTAQALAAGATEEEVAEAVALGIAFGGAPAAMFYQSLLHESASREG